MDDALVGCARGLQSLKNGWRHQLHMGGDLGERVVMEGLAWRRRTAGVLPLGAPDRPGFAQISAYMGILRLQVVVSSLMGGPGLCPRHMRGRKSLVGLLKPRQAVHNGAELRLRRCADGLS